VLDHFFLCPAAYPYYPALDIIIGTAVQNNICSNTSAGTVAEEVSAHLQRRQSMLDSHPDLQWWRDMFN